MHGIVFSATFDPKNPDVSAGSQTQTIGDIQVVTSWTLQLCK